MEGHLFDKEWHLFDGKGHLFWEGSQFCYKLLGGQNFDHVYEPLEGWKSSEFSGKELWAIWFNMGHSKYANSPDRPFHNFTALMLRSDVQIKYPNKSTICQDIRKFGK